MSQIMMMAAEKKQLHIETPLLESVTLSKQKPTFKNVFLKMENCQRSGSFKMRGFGRICQKLKEEGSQHIIAVTSGNTGLAVACASKMIGIPCTIFVPENSPPLSAEKIKEYGARVLVKGKDYNDAIAFAKEEEKKLGASRIDSMDPEVWTGHSTMIDELVTQLSEKPSVIVVSVGDGGLLTGVLKGLERTGWKDVPVVAMETIGTECLNQSIKANKLITLNEITSIATSLGAKTVIPHLFDILPEFNVISEVVTDAQVVQSCIKFMDDEYIMVEPSCGATLAAVYCGVLERLHSEQKLPYLSERPVVIIVCGGRSVSISLLQEWAKQFNVPFPTFGHKNK